MRKLLILILFVSISFSETIDTSKIKSMNVSFTVKYTVAVNNGNILAVSINMSVPQKTEYQLIDYPGRHGVDPNGNLFARIDVENPSNPFTVSITTNVMTTGRTTKELPPSYNVPDDAVKYTMVTDRIQSNSPDIQNLALNITANSTSNFERVAKLSMYVKSLVDYDISYAGAWKDALWILKNKKGVCLEYATLFAAMVRSLGIPARILVGYAYDSSADAMVGHAWNEVYVGKWVPVDPLWGEVGYLDGGHVEAARIIDNEIPDNSSLKWSDWGNAKVYTKSSTSDPIYKAEPIFHSISFLEKVGNYTLELQSANITGGNSTKVELTFNGTDYRVVTADLVPECGTPLTIDDIEKTIIIEPGKIAKATWVVTADGRMKKDADTCQLSFTSDYLEGKNLSLTLIRPKQVGTISNVTQPQKPGQTTQKNEYCLPLFVLLPLLSAAFYRNRK